MGDTLLYRLPNSRIIQCSGSFKEVENFEAIQGFIISSYDSHRKYCFEEKDLPQEIHLTDDQINEITKEQYKELGTELLEELNKGEVNKAVLSRVKRMSTTSNPTMMFYLLCENYPDAFVYMVSSPLFGTWLGATPEVLIRSNSTHAETYALAGTIDSESDKEWTNKELDEQQYVSDYIGSILEENQIQYRMSDRRSIKAGPVRHLLTTIDFNIEPSKLVNLLDQLHPTPAVCGIPKEKALDLINAMESHDRELYSGYIGILGNNSSVYVNLRCAKVKEDGLYLFLGGGYTKDSIVENEWEETEFKAKTLLNLLENQ